MKSLRRADGNYVYLTALCTVAYLVSYVSRINLSACMVAMVQSGYAPQNTVALALSLCAVTYGLGQIVSGWLGGYFRPQNVIFSGFLITGVVNLLVGILPGAGSLPLLWAVNGFAQALMWPPMLAIIAALLSGEHYSRCCVWVGRGSAIGTIAVYALSPLILRLFDVYAVFLFSSSLSLGMAVAWKFLFKRRYHHISINERLSSKTFHSAPVNAPRFGRREYVLVGLILIAIALQGMLRDGVTNWLPTFAVDLLHLDSSSAILTGLLLPLFHLLCYQIFMTLHLKYVRNEMLCAGMIFAAAIPAAMLCALFIDGASTVFLLALLVGCMHGVNMVLVSFVPRHFLKYGRMSVISGIFNSFTYVGGAFSTYGIAVLSSSYGWRTTVFAWTAIAVVGALLCLSLTGRWHRFCRE